MRFVITEFVNGVDPDTTLWGKAGVNSQDAVLSILSPTTLADTQIVYHVSQTSPHRQYFSVFGHLPHLRRHFVCIVDNQEPSARAFPARGVLDEYPDVSSVINPKDPQFLTNLTVGRLESGGIQCRNPKHRAVRVPVTEVEGSLVIGLDESMVSIDDDNCRMSNT